MSTAQKTTKPFEKIYQNTRSNTRSRRTKSFTHARLKSYINATGPGDYDLPNLWGALKTASNYNNGPFFSMGQRCKTPIISKKHIQDIIGKSKF